MPTGIRQPPHARRAPACVGARIQTAGAGARGRFPGPAARHGTAARLAPSASASRRTLSRLTRYHPRGFRIRVGHGHRHAARLHARRENRCFACAPPAHGDGSLPALAGASPVDPQHVAVIAVGALVERTQQPDPGAARRRWCRTRVRSCVPPGSSTFAPSRRFGAFVESGKISIIDEQPGHRCLPVISRAIPWFTSNSMADATV